MRARLAWPAEKKLLPPDAEAAFAAFALPGAELCGWSNEAISDTQDTKN